MIRSLVSRFAQTVASMSEKIALMVYPSSLRRCVPVMTQMSAAECGAACLAMVLSYFGRSTSVAECREFLGIGRDGVSAHQIAEGARRHGLRVKAFKVEPAGLASLEMPAIAHWSFNHFVIVERWSPKTVHIVDPAVGRRTLSAAEFDTNFTGVVLTLAPTIQFESQNKTSETSSWNYVRLMLLVRGVRGILLQVLAASLLLQCFGLALPFLTQIVVDRILPFHMAGLMNVIGAGLIVLVLAYMVTAYLRATLLLYLQARLDSRIILSFFEHLLSLPLRFFQQRPSGDLLMRANSNGAIREILTNRTVSVLLDGGFVIGYLGILFFFSPGFGAAVLALGGLQVVLMLVTNRHLKALTSSEFAASAEAQSYMVETLMGVATLKASGAEDHAFEHWSNLYYKQLNVSLRRGHLNALLDTAMTTLRILSPILLLWLGVVQTLNGKMSLGSMLALNALAISFLTPVASLVTAGQQLQLVRAHLERIVDVAHAQPEQNREMAKPCSRLTGKIQLENVSFRYDPNSPWVLRDISLTIAPGQKVALVGATGSGKSTLAKLLLSLYTPEQGEIFFDDLPLQMLDYRMLRNQFGVVLQESSLFRGSIRQNIAMNDPGLPLEQIQQAARLAQVHDEIMDMPMGYETLLAEVGTGVSGGQRQRICVARAIAHRPSVILLDEATSHLDVRTERLVSQNLESLTCTRLMIAHRLSTVIDADLIVVLEKGRMVEQGTHDELLAMNGYYAALISGGASNGEMAAYDARQRLSMAVDSSE
jgi:ATP-binding cassette, subfamily B, bacterial